MEQKSEIKRGRVEALPGNSDKEFWAEAETHQIDIKEGPPCRHYFIQKTGREVACKYGCGTIYMISPKEHLLDGHIYRGGIKLV